MNEARMLSPRRYSRALWSLALAALLCGVQAEPPPALAEVPAGSPVFTAPNEVTNTHLPFVPGAVKVFSGRDHGDQVMIVESHLVETRDFVWDDQAVTCRIIEQLQFVDGAHVATEQRFLAQAADGSVWTFGEVEDTDPNDDNGDDKNEPGGWVVGNRAPTDPPDLVTGAQPSLLMPAQPSTGDTWLTENIPPHLVASRTVRNAGATLRLTTGRHRGTLKVRENDVSDASRETHWFAPGLGLVMTRGFRERLSLQATTIRTGR